MDALRDLIFAGGLEGGSAARDALPYDPISAATRRPPLRSRIVQRITIDLQNAPNLVQPTVHVQPTRASPLPIRSRQVRTKLQQSPPDPHSPAVKGGARAAHRICLCPCPTGAVAAAVSQAKWHLFRTLLLSGPHQIPRRIASRPTPQIRACCLLFPSPVGVPSMHRRRVRAA